MNLSAINAAIPVRLTNTKYAGLGLIIDYDHAEYRDHKMLIKKDHIICTQKNFNDSL
jgi:hypothetical protein